MLFRSACSHCGPISRDLQMYDPCAGRDEVADVGLLRADCLEPRVQVHVELPESDVHARAEVPLALRDEVHETFEIGKGL